MGKKRTAKRRKATPEQAEHIRQEIERIKPFENEMREEARELWATHKLSRQAIAELRAERERQGLSLADLKERTGMSRATISILENNDRPNPTISTLMRLATALGVDLQLGIKRPAKN